MTKLQVMTVLRVKGTAEFLWADSPETRATAEFPFSSCPQLWTCAKDPSYCPSLTWNQKSQGSVTQREEDIPG